MTVRSSKVPHRLRSALAGGVVLGALALPSMAAASPPSPGQQAVQVNPGSPAGQEYVIPIPAARSEAAGGPAGAGGGGSGGTPGGGSGAPTGGGAGTAGGGAGGQNANPPLFGIGITPPSGAQTSASGTARGSQGSGASGSAPVASSPSSGSTPAVPATNRPVSLASISHPGSAGGTGWLALVGGGLLVLIVGGGGGFAVRRRLSHS